jgi:hypothetical protein
MSRIFFKRLIFVPVLLLTLLPLGGAYGSDKVNLLPGIQEPGAVQVVNLALDGVALTLTTPFLPTQNIILPEPDDSVQVANVVQREPIFQSLSITAIPYGSVRNAEIFPVAEPGKVDVYRESLVAYRESQGGAPQEGPVATLFDEEISGIMSTVELFVDVFAPKPVRIVEWVVEAGNRLWILRTSQEISIIEQGADKRSSERTTEQLAGISLSGANLNVQSTSVYARENQVETAPYIAATDQSDLPFPSWWDGDCDTNTYHTKSELWAYPLGGSYRGVKACGPRPWYDGAPDVLVRFFPGSWGVLEWECVELSMRFLYLAYGIVPYQANGNQVVPHYSGDQLIKINNGTPGFAPQPNDVMSSGPETTYGHTMVVIASNVDPQGNGTITILEQNSSVTGVRLQTVTNWEVQSYYPVIGWLHDPDTTSNTILYFPLIRK